MQVIHDNWGEFIGHEFQDMLQEFGITAKPTKVKNPQLNAIVERLHRIMADILGVMIHISAPHNQPETTNMIDNALAGSSSACIEMLGKPYYENITRSNSFQSRHDDEHTTNFQSNSNWKSKTTTCRQKHETSKCKENMTQLTTILATESNL